MHCRRRFFFFIKIAFLLLFCVWNLIKLTRFAFSLFQGSVSSVPSIINASLEKGGTIFVVVVNF